MGVFELKDPYSKSEGQFEKKESLYSLLKEMRREITELTSSNKDLAESIKLFAKVVIYFAGGVVLVLFLICTFLIFQDTNSSISGGPTGFKFETHRVPLEAP